MSAPLKSIQLILVIHLGGFLGLTSILADLDEFEGQRTLQVEHSFDTGPDAVFTKRGTIAIRSVKSNKAHFQPMDDLHPDDRIQLRNLAERNGIYRIRIPLKSSSSSEEDFVSTFSLACSLYESSLSDKIIVNVDQSGEVMGVSVMASQAQCIGTYVPDRNLTDWNTAVEITQTVQGPTPDTQTYIEKMKRDEQERAKGQQGDNRSFFARYWMYIVPFVIVMMLMSSADPQNQGR